MIEDIQDKNNIPILAEVLYSKYRYDVIPFIADLLETSMKNIQSIYPNIREEERVNILQALKLEIVMKFCHHAENLAAISTAFTKNYNDSKDEAVGLFDTFNNYKVKQMDNFLEKIPERNLDYVGKFFGYPPLSIQNSSSLETIKRWNTNAKEEYEKIAENYLVLKDLYNAYKHGYRIIFGTVSNRDDAYVFLSEGKTKQITITNDKFEEIKKLIRTIEKIMKMIFANHLERKKFEERDELTAQIDWHYLLKKGDPPHDPKMRTQLTKRGERRKKEIEEGNEIYKKIQSELEKKHLNKIVVLDLDSSDVIGIADTKEEAVRLLHESSSSGRKYIRKIGSDDKTGLEYY